MSDRQLRIAWGLMQQSRETGNRPLSTTEALIRAAWLLEIESSQADESFALCQARTRRYSAKLRASVP